MSVLGLFFITIAKVLSMILNAYMFVVLGAVIISWFRPDPYNPIVRFITQITEPLFSQVRKRMPAFLQNTGIDFTPLAIFILITMIDTFVVGLLYDAGYSLRASGMMPHVSGEAPLPQI